MSWNPHMEVRYLNSGSPYNSIGSFVNYFEGLTYEHVNFIFADASYAQETSHPSMSSNFYKFGLSEPGSLSYYDYTQSYAVNDHGLGMDEYNTNEENPSMMVDEQATPLPIQRDANPSSTPNANPIELQVWQDNVDPDNMTYEELLELGEAVGTQSRGLSPDAISLLPVSKFKRGFYFRKKSRHERCVICQMEYQRGDRQITLPCKHAYHAGCGSRWLGINKACPICYKEVFGDASKL